MTPTRIRWFRAGIVSAAVGFVACGGRGGNEPVPGVPDPDASPAGVPLALVGVRVVPMLTNTVLDDQTVVVEGGAVTAIGPRATVRVPTGAVVAGQRPVRHAGAHRHAHARLARETVKAQVEVRRIDGMVLGGAWRPAAR